MTDVDATEAEIEAVAKEARKTFNLSDRLKGRTQRTGSVTVYLDEIAGQTLGGAEDIVNSLQMKVGRNRWGLLGEIDLAVFEEREEDIAALREKVDEVGFELYASAITFHLRAVPELITKKCSKDALASQGIKGKVPDEKILEFNSSFNANMLAACIYKTVDAEGSISEGVLSNAEAEELENLLPRSEYAKLYSKLQEIQFKQAISDSATSSATF